jgi:hypothetical protein
MIIAADSVGVPVALGHTFFVWLFFSKELFPVAFFVFNGQRGAGVQCIELFSVLCIIC